MVFETDRCIARWLQIRDKENYYLLQSNSLVMKYVGVPAKNKKGNYKELLQLIEKYNLPQNDFWIYAVERKRDGQFLGTCALVKDEDKNDELGYRLMPEFWGQGYGYEICTGIVNYSRKIGKKLLMGYVAHKNIASSIILSKCGFQEIAQGVDPNLNIPETIYKLHL